MTDKLYYSGEIIYNFPGRKVKLTLTVDSSLVEWAKRMRINLSATLESLLAKEYSRRNEQ